jgi:serine protease Do
MKNLQKKNILSFIISSFIFLFFNFSAKSQGPNSFADLAEKLLPSVVNISATKIIETRANSFNFNVPPGSPFEDLFKEFDKNGVPQKRKTQSLGSGFVIDKDGTIITCNHVIQGAEGILVKFINGKQYEAKLVGSDPTSDIAVLKIKTKDNLQSVSLGDSDKARVGDWVLAIGNPFGLGGTVTAGIVSARNRDINLGKYDDFIQTDASINQGNSGGPLFNVDGQVIGINSAILSQTGGSVGIGFAIPSNLAKHNIEQLIKFGEIKRGFIGVRIQEVTKEIADSLGLSNEEGALIASITANGPASKAGLEAGDVILEFDNKKIENMRKLPRVVADTPIGQNVAIKIWRNKQLITKQITVEKLTEEKVSKNKLTRQNSGNSYQSIFIKELKIKIRDITDDDVKQRPNLENIQGVYISDVEGLSPLAQIGIKAGDIIVAVANIKINNLTSFQDQFKNQLKRNQNSILLTILDKDNQSRFVGVKIK